MLLKIDAVFEGALGFVLLLAAATGTLGSSDFPTPVGQVVLLVVGCALLMLCGLISSGRIGLRALALGNGVTALAGLAWLFGAAGWSNAGAALVAVTVAVLVLLAAAQAATLRA
jgi:hypothetical protein